MLTMRTFGSYTNQLLHSARPPRGGQILHIITPTILLPQRHPGHRNASQLKLATYAIGASVGGTSRREIARQLSLRGINQKSKELNYVIPLASMLSDAKPD